MNNILLPTTATMNLEDGERPKFIDEILDPE